MKAQLSHLGNYLENADEDMGVQYSLACEDWEQLFWGTEFKGSELLPRLVCWCIICSFSFDQHEEQFRPRPST